MMEDCRKVRNNISAFLDNELSPGRAAEIKAHLSVCESCSGHLEELMVLSRCVAGIKEARTPEHMWEKIEAELVPSPSRFFSALFWKWIPVTAMVVLTLSVLIIYNGRNTSSGLLEFTELEQDFQEEIEDLYFEYL